MKAEVRGAMKAMGALSNLCALLVAGILLSGVGVPAQAANVRYVSLPVPKVTLNPGVVIDLGMLEQKRFQTQRVDRFSVIPQSSELLGKEVLYTLHPGDPINRSSIARREVIKRGDPAQLIFNEQGLNIIAHVEPLEDGIVGDIIRVRNLDSGIVVRGRVEPNGTISIGP